MEIIDIHLATCGVLLRHAKGYLGSSIVIDCFQFGDFFLVVCTSTSESGETSEQKRGSRKTLILWSRHCAHYLSQTLWRVFDFPSQKHILVIWFPFSTRNIFSVSQIFKSFLETQRPNPTEMCDLRYAYTSHVQKSFFSTNIRFSSRQIPGSVLNLSFCSNSKCPQFHPWVEVSPCWYINIVGVLGPVGTVRGRSTTIPDYSPSEVRCRSLQPSLQTPSWAAPPAGTSPLILK